MCLWYGLRLEVVVLLVMLDGLVVCVGSDGWNVVILLV